jgi:hypothetical protein
MTRLAAAAVAAIEASPESAGSECGVVLLLDGGEGGSATFGFDDDDDAIRFLLTHVEALCKAAGRPFRVLDVSGN